MKHHPQAKRSMFDAASDPFDLTPEELGMIDPDAQSKALEFDQLQAMAEGIAEAARDEFRRLAA